MSKGTIKQLGEVTEFTLLKFSGGKSDRKPRREWQTNAARLENNLARAKRAVKELALCNPWEYWVTFTISPDKYDRYDLETIYKDFSEFVHNRTNPPRYVVVPELHKDGAIHLHALMYSIPFRELVEINGRLNWKPYFDRFGFSLVEPIRDRNRAAFYMLKYITKEAGQAVPRGKQIFRCSKGLARAETLALVDQTIDGDEYARFVRNFESLDTLEYETDFIRRKTFGKP